MTDLAPLRKVIFLCAAVATAAVLSGCNDANLSKTFADIKAIKVDDSGSSANADDRKLSKQDLELAVNTAKDLTINKGGLLDHGATPNELPIAVVDPSTMTRPDEAPLDERLPGQAETPPLRGVPLQPQTQDKAEAPAPAPQSGRFIQVGSFASAGAAKNAWAGLIERYPGVDRYSASYQTVTLASGKAMVRLKVGPVSGDHQARDLCDQLNIRDAWCSRAG